MNATSIAREEAAARMLHEASNAHMRLTAHLYPAWDGAQAAWEEASEQDRQSLVALVDKARGSFEDFYAFTTQAERMGGLPVPEATDDVERVRAARMQYAIVQHFLRVDDHEQDGECRFTPICPCGCSRAPRTQE